MARKIETMVKAINKNYELESKKSAELNAVLFERGRLVNDVMTSNEYNENYKSFRQFCEENAFTVIENKGKDNEIKVRDERKALADSRQAYLFKVEHKLDDTVHFSNVVKVMRVKQLDVFIEFASELGLDIYHCKVRELSKAINEHNACIKENDENAKAEAEASAFKQEITSENESVASEVIEVTDPNGNIYAIPMSVLAQYRK